MHIYSVILYLRHTMFVNVQYMFIQLVTKEKFSVNRRVCVSMEDLKFNKKTWSKGLDPSAVSIIIGQNNSLCFSLYQIVLFE